MSLLEAAQGSVNNEEFNRQVGGLGVGTARFNVREIGIWSDMDWIPIFASETTRKSLRDMNKYGNQSWNIGHVGQNKR